MIDTHALILPLTHDHGWLLLLHKSSVNVVRGIITVLSRYNVFGKCVYIYNHRVPAYLISLS